MFPTQSKEDAVHNLKSAANTVRNEARETAGELRDELRDTANRAGRKVRGFIDSASDELSHASDTVTTQIRSNPVQSSLIALGIGYVLGALFRR